MDFSEDCDLDLWWVYVVHTDSKPEYVQVNQFVNWTPKRPDDFIKSDKYTLRTKKWRKDGKYDRCKVHILRMAETLDKLKESINKKRPAIPRLEIRESDFVSDTDATTNNTKKRSSHGIQADLAAKKARADLKEMERFASSPLIAPGISPTADTTITSTPLQDTLRNPQSHPSNSAVVKPAKPKIPGPVLKRSTCASSTPHSAPSKNAVHYSSFITSNSSTTQKPPAKLPNSQGPTVSSSPTTSAVVLNPKRSKRDTKSHSTVSVEQSRPNAVPRYSETSTSKVESNVTQSVTGNQSVVQANVKTYTEADLKKKDEELERLRRQLDAAQAELDAAKARLIQKDDVILNEILNLSHRMGKVEEVITKMSNSSSSEQRSNLNGYVPPEVTINGDEVHLGEGIVCTLSAWNTMTSTSDDTMWGNAFVMGVLKDDAHLYGLLPRTGKMKFAENFKRIALLHWTAYLVRKGNTLPLPKKLVQSILGKLSSRCHDSAGRRNTGTRRRSATAPGVDDIRDDPNEPDGGVILIDPETGLMEDGQGRLLLPGVRNGSQDSPTANHQPTIDESVAGNVNYDTDIDDRQNNDDHNNTRPEDRNIDSNNDNINGENDVNDNTAECVEAGDDVDADDDATDDDDTEDDASDDDTSRDSII